MRKTMLVFVLMAACVRTNEKVLVGVDPNTVVTIADQKEIELTVNTNKFQKMIRRMPEVVSVELFDNGSGFFYLAKNVNGWDFGEPPADQLENAVSGETLLRVPMKRIISHKLPWYEGPHIIEVPKELMQKTDSVCLRLYFASMVERVNSHVICVDR